MPVTHPINHIYTFAEYNYFIKWCYHSLSAIEAPPSCWAVLNLPDEQGSKVLMAIDSIVYELDSFQSKTKVSDTMSIAD